MAGLELRRIDTAHATVDMVPPLFRDDLPPTSVQVAGRRVEDLMDPESVVRPLVPYAGPDVEGRWDTWIVSVGGRWCSARWAGVAIELQ